MLLSLKCPLSKPCVVKSFGQLVVSLAALSCPLWAGFVPETRNFFEAMQATEASADNEKDIDKILKEFWERTLQEIQASQPSTKYSLPLARIKKIMRFDEDVNMVSQEVLRMFDKCCVFFIQELTLRAWQSTLDSDRKTIKARGTHMFNYSPTEES